MEPAMTGTSVDRYIAYFARTLKLLLSVMPVVNSPLVWTGSQTTYESPPTSGDSPAQ